MRIAAGSLAFLTSLTGLAAAADEPLTAAERLAPGVISTGAIEDAAAFSPDGRVVVFARRAGRWGGPPEPGTLFVSRRSGAQWSEPEPLPFSGRHDDGDPAFAPDGRLLYFTSSRPAGDGRQDADIWAAARNGDAWGEPRHLGNVVNSPAAEFSPSIAASGRLYFASARDGGLGQGDLYVAEPAAGGFAAPRNLGARLNSATGEWNVTVDPDERFLVFEASGRATNRSVSGDLYVSYRLNGAWSAPVPLDAVNTTASELNARLSADGQRFHFARSTAPAPDRHADLWFLPAASVLPHLAPAHGARVVAVSRSAHEIVVLEAGTWRRLARLPVGKGPHEIAVSPDGNLAYTADYGQFPRPHDQPIEPGPVNWMEAPSGTISMLDVSAMRRLGTLPVAECTRNHGILASRDGRRLWTTCEVEGAVDELDARTGKKLRRFATGIGSHQLAVTPDESLLVASNVESGTVSLVELATGAVTTLRTGRGAEGLALSPDGRWLWVGNAQDHTLSIVDLRERRVAGTIGSGGRFPVKLGFTVDGREVWVVNTASRSIAVFDAATRAQHRTLQFDSPPLGILPAPGGDVMLVTFPRRNELAVLSAADGSTLATVPGIVEADGIAWMPARSGR